MKSKVLILVIVVVAVGLGICYKLGVFSPKDINVIIISMDTTRADHLSCYGFEKNATPNIDNFSSEAILFETAISPVPMTFPSHSSIMTGTSPLYHGVHDNIDEHFDDANVTLAEILSGKGYTTGAIVSTVVLDSKNGLGQGFDSYEDHNKAKTGLDGARLAAGRLAEETTALACDWLDKNGDESFFLFVHYFDAHLPYAPPEPFASEYKDDLYAGEIAYMDDSIGTLFDKLKSKDLYEDTVVVVIGDHGEMLGEHGETEHSFYIYDSVVKVPMIIKPAGTVTPARVKENAGLIDIVPTVCSMVGIDDELTFQGEDLSVLFDGATVRQEKRYYYIESLTPKKYSCNSLLGVVESDWKYIQTTRPELYNTSQDKFETNNLIEEEANRARLMKETLQIILEDEVRKSEASKETRHDSESLEQLASLGYVGGGVEESFEFDQSKYDPKDMIAVHEKFKVAMMHFVKKEHDDALKLSNEIQKDYPSIALGHDLAANIAYDKGDMDLAIFNYLKAIKLKPKEPALLHKLAFCYQKSKQFKKSVETWERFLEARPDNVVALNGLGTDLVSIGKPKLAMESWASSLEINPAQPEIHNKMALMYFLKGDMENVSAHWKAALKYRPDWDKVLNDLAWIYATKKESKIYNPQEAVTLALEACRLSIYSDPGYLDTLSVAYAEIGSYNDAITYGEKAILIFQAAGRTSEAEKTRKRVESYK